MSPAAPRFPCVRCNQRVKFTDLLGWRANSAPIASPPAIMSAACGRRGAELHRAVDPARDQSYFLFATTRDAARLSALSAGRHAQGARARALRPSSGWSSRPSPTARTSASCPTAIMPRSCANSVPKRRRRATSSICRAACWDEHRGHRRLHCRPAPRDRNRRHARAALCGADRRGRTPSGRRAKAGVGGARGPPERHQLAGRGARTSICPSKSARLPSRCPPPSMVRRCISMRPNMALRRARRRSCTAATAFSAAAGSKRRLRRNWNWPEFLPST